MTERRELDPALTSLPRICRHKVPAVFELCEDCDQYHLVQAAGEAVHKARESWFEARIGEHEQARDAYYTAADDLQRAIEGHND